MRELDRISPGGPVFSYKLVRGGHFLGGGGGGEGGNQNFP